MIPIQQLIQLIAQFAGSAAEANAETGYAYGSGGNQYTSMAKKATKFKDPVAAGVFGYLGGKKDKKQRKKYKKKIEANRAITRSVFGKGIQGQEAMSRLQTQQELGGYDVARREAQRLGGASRQGALDSAAQLGASATQGLASRGLGSTTIGANVQRGIASDTNRQMQAINEGLAGIYGDLALGRAGTEAQGTANLADLAQQKTMFDLQDANFWTPQLMNTYGHYEGMKLGGGPLQQGQAGPDFNMIADLYKQQPQPKKKGAGGTSIDASSIIELLQQLLGGGG